MSTLTDAQKVQYEQSVLRLTVCAFATTLSSVCYSAGRYDPALHLAAYNSRLQALGVAYPDIIDPIAGFWPILFVFMTLLTRGSGADLLALALPRCDGNDATDGMAAMLPLQKLQTVATSACSNANLNKVYDATTDFVQMPQTMEDVYAYLDNAKRMIACAFVATLKDAFMGGYDQTRHSSLLQLKLASLVPWDMVLPEFTALLDFNTLYTSLSGSAGHSQSLNDVLAYVPAAQQVHSVTNLQCMVVPLWKLRETVAAMSVGVDFNKLYTIADFQSPPAAQPTAAPVAVQAESQPRLQAQSQPSTVALQSATIAVPPPVEVRQQQFAPVLPNSTPTAPASAPAMSTASAMQQLQSLQARVPPSAVKWIRIALIVVAALCVVYILVSIVMWLLAPKTPRTYYSAYGGNKGRSSWFDWAQ